MRVESVGFPPGFIFVWQVFQFYIEGRLPGLLPFVAFTSQWVRVLQVLPALGGTSVVYDACTTWQKN